ncbi:hypothetical protein CVS40_11842 [Lucilia cuprina]|nr:hypothetical protein CVS40_11842 [Lucilia cuprina]
MADNPPTDPVRRTNVELPSGCRGCKILLSFPRLENLGLSKMADNPPTDPVRRTNAELPSGCRDAIRQAVQEATQAVLNSVPHQQISTNPKPPPFSFSEYRSTYEITVCDYFTRHEWALKLSKIPEEEYANYARVNIGAELNNALKVLMSPRSPDNATYSELKNALISHFDAEKNKYAESIKFRRTLQENGETMANFALRLKQATSFCEYAEFLDRMLIEQFLVGLKSQPICDDIIAKKPSTFREAYEIAHALESSHQTTTDMKTSVTLPQSADLTNKVGTFSQRRNERKHAPNMRQGDNRIK